MSDLDRRLFLKLCGLTGGALVLPVLGCDDGAAGPEGAPDAHGDGAPDAATGDGAPDAAPGDAAPDAAPDVGPDAAAGGDATADGGPPEDPDALPIPPLLEGTLADGVRSFSLELQTGTMAWVAGAVTTTWGVNGPFLGPTLRFRRGERVRVSVTNRLPVVSTLHWHGMEVPARADGGPYVPIVPDTTWVSEYDIVQRASLAWYHPHPMHETARQVYMGMAGLIRVEDGAEPDLPSTYGVDDLPLVIQDRRLFADGTHPYSNGRTPPMHDHMAGMRGDYILVNGKQTPRARVPKGLIRLRILNGSNARNYHLGFADDRRFHLIATDGGLLAAPVETTRVLLAPGERAEILVDFSQDAEGIDVALQSASGEVFGALFTGQMGANLTDALDRETFHIMNFATDARSLPHRAVPATFEPIAAPVAAQAVRTRNLELSMRMGMGGGGVFINGEAMMDLDTVPAAIDFRIPAGDIELWVVTNTSGMAHPLHIHNRSFQIVDLDGAAPPPHLAGWKDTVLIRPRQVVRLLVNFAGSPDEAFPYMFHCHILEHEDMGMMGRFFIV